MSPTDNNDDPLSGLEARRDGVLAGAPQGAVLHGWRLLPGENAEQAHRRMLLAFIDTAAADGVINYEGSNTCVEVVEHWLGAQVDGRGVAPLEPPSPPIKEGAAMTPDPARQYVDPETGETKTLRPGPQPKGMEPPGPLATKIRDFMSGLTDDQLESLRMALPPPWWDLIHAAVMEPDDEGVVYVFGHMAHMTVEDAGLVAGCSGAPRNLGAVELERDHWKQAAEAWLQSLCHEEARADRLEQELADIKSARLDKMLADLKHPEGASGPRTETT